jgi:hypothetical protein
MKSNLKLVPQKEKHIFYVSVGAKEVLYTLRKMIVDKFGNSLDSYICNLAVNKVDALAKAQEFFDLISARAVTATPEINLILSLETEYETSQIFKSRKALSDERITQIEQGITPIGCYRGFKITELPEHYVLWLADQFTGNFATANDRVFQTLASVALGLALERKLFDQKTETKNTTCHLGEIGQRITFKAEISQYEVSLSFYGNIIDYTLLVDGKIVKYRGSKYIGSEGQHIKLKATIDEHLTIKDGSEMTFIKRPTLV